MWNQQNSLTFYCRWISRERQDSHTISMAVNSEYHPIIIMSLLFVFNYFISVLHLDALPVQTKLDQTKIFWSSPKSLLDQEKEKGPIIFGQYQTNSHCAYFLTDSPINESKVFDVNFLLSCVTFGCLAGFKLSI